MATITEAKLALTHDHKTQTVRALVTCKVNFTGLELCMMKSCPDQRLFKLRCYLFGQDVTNPDDLKYTYESRHYFPDPTSSATESRTFDVLLGAGALDEDTSSADEIYGQLRLTNLFTLVAVKKNTNVVTHAF
jgi:hypothetical protein